VPISTTTFTADGPRGSALLGRQSDADVRAAGLDRPACAVSHAQNSGGSPGSSFHFGRCELRPEPRELLVDGAIRNLEPLAFNLLVYLLQHRERVVSKDELLDNVWRGRIVSVGAVARAVMLVRQAIARPGEAELIRTVHCVGYRFVGEVREASAPCLHDRPIIVALLPPENLTGDLSLDCATIGLMAQVGNTLALDALIAPLPVQDVWAAVRQLDASASVEQRVKALRRHHDVEHIVHTRLTRRRPGYGLDYTLLSWSQTPAGTIVGHDLLELGRALSGRLLAHLRPTSQATHTCGAAHDPWATQLYARAVQAAANKSWVRAVHMLRVVLDLDPHHAKARRELQRIEYIAAGEGCLLDAPFQDQRGPSRAGHPACDGSLALRAPVALPSGSALEAVNLSS
jgi:DNA-binding winged helix-turn-helix (wHTH) protein